MPGSMPCSGNCSAFPFQHDSGLLQPLLQSAWGKAGLVLRPLTLFTIRFLLFTSSSRCCWAAPLHLGQAEGFASPPDFHHTLGAWAITQ